MMPTKFSIKRIVLPFFELKKKFQEEEKADKPIEKKKKEKRKRGPGLTNEL
jgi:hypothetical protein